LNASKASSIYNPIVPTSAFYNNSAIQPDSE
jgi:hypothetical protein